MFFLGLKSRRTLTIVLIQVCMAVVMGHFWNFCNLEALGSKVVTGGGDMRCGLNVFPLIPIIVLAVLFR